MLGVGKMRALIGNLNRLMSNSRSLSPTRTALICPWYKEIKIQHSDYYALSFLFLEIESFPNLIAKEKFSTMYQLDSRKYFLVTFFECYGAAEIHGVQGNPSEHEANLVKTQCYTSD